MFFFLILGSLVMSTTTTYDFNFFSGYKKFIALQTPRDQKTTLQFIAFLFTILRLQQLFVLQKLDLLIKSLKCICFTIALILCSHFCEKFLLQLERVLTPPSLKRSYNQPLCFLKLPMFLYFYAKFEVSTEILADF